MISELGFSGYPTYVTGVAIVAQTRRLNDYKKALVLI